MEQQPEIGQFVLQIVGITDGKVLSRPARKHPRLNDLADVKIIKDNANVLAYVPSFSCDGMADNGVEVLLAPCPPDAEDSDIVFSLGNNDPFTHSVFLTVFREIKDQLPKPSLFNKVAPITAASTSASTTSTTSSITSSTSTSAEDSDEEEDEDNEQFIAINPKIAIELMESIIEKKLMRLLPTVKQFKRNVPMYLEGKVDSTFSFGGFCEDGIPFIVEVYNVPFAEYNHGKRTHEKGPGFPAVKNKFNTKTAYFPEKNCPNTQEMIQRIKDISMVKRESVTRCILAYIVQRTDVDRFQFSLYDDEYRQAVREAIEVGVQIVPIVISWTREGIALFVTDDMQVVYPAE
jgi:DNA-binding sugar fermentation-stimulating protein